MTAPFRIYINGQELLQYTGASLSRKKQDLTGLFQCDVFFNYMPARPVMVNAMRGADVDVYVNNRLAFTGALDRRSGKSKHIDENGLEVESSIEPNAYNVSFTARGKTKYMIEASHQVEKGMLKNTSSKKAIEELTRQLGVEIVWEAEDVKLPQVVFRDGNSVLLEVQRICNENGHYLYETKDGRLKIQDIPRQLGEDLILGRNILRFNSDQSEEHDRSRFIVKGQRTDRRVWGEEAVLNVAKAAKKNGSSKDVPYIIQHYGDGSQEALERRLKYEADKRTAQSLRVSLEVFHIQQSSGEPWDIGELHYVEVPPEGIFNVLEVVELKYLVDAAGTLKTSLTLAPPPSEKDGPSPSSNKASVGSQRKAQLGVNSTDFWSPADLNFDSTFLTPEVPDSGYFYLDGISTNLPPDKIS